MDTLRDRLEELAEDAPRGGAPAAELWVRGKRIHRLRSAALGAAILVVLGTVGTGIGVRLVGGEDGRSSLASKETVRLALPIKYPIGEELPDLGSTPGPLAAIWLAPRAGAAGGAPQAVGLVAGTGTFGTLPIELSSTHYDAPDSYFALSPDGRRIAYSTPREQVVVRDLASGRTYTLAFEFEVREGYTWVDATHLVGHVAGGSDVDGWVWDVLESGTAPKLIDLREYPGSPWLGRSAGRDPWFLERQDGSACSLPTLNAKGWPVLCRVAGVIGSDIALTFWNSEVVALHRGDAPFDDPAARRVVATAGAPQRVAFATDLIARALEAADGAS